MFDSDGAFQGYRGTGRDVTEEIAVAARAEQAEVEQPVAEIARLSVDRLIDRLQGTLTNGAVQKILAPKLVVRNSTARYSGK